MWVVILTGSTLDIASISAVEGKNWRHGDIEDVLKTIACIKHHKWNTMMIKRVYFGYVLVVRSEVGSLTHWPGTGLGTTVRLWTQVREAHPWNPRPGGSEGFIFCGGRLCANNALAALKKAQPETIRILVWLLSFLGFGYATAEFEVTSERLGVYRPEEHIE